MLPVIKIFMTDTLIMSDITFFCILTVSFLCGFPVGVILYHFTGKLLRRIFK